MMMGPSIIQKQVWDRVSLLVVTLLLVVSLPHCTGAKQRADDSTSHYIWKKQSWILSAVDNVRVETLGQLSTGIYVIELGVKRDTCRSDERNGTLNNSMKRSMKNLLYTFVCPLQNIWGLTIEHAPLQRRQA